MERGLADEFGPVLFGDEFADAAELFELLRFFDERATGVEGADDEVMGVPDRFEVTGAAAGGDGVVAAFQRAKDELAGKTERPTVKSNVWRRFVERWVGGRR